MKLGLAKTRSAEDSRDLLASTGLRIGPHCPHAKSSTWLKLLPASYGYLRQSRSQPMGYQTSGIKRYRTFFWYST
jgi:hypothetical protein